MQDDNEGAESGESSHVIVKNDDGSKTITLLFPFKYGDRQITDVTIKRFKGKHLKTLSEKRTIGEMLLLAGKNMAEPPAFFDEMDGEDVAALMEVMGDFLGASRRTGDTA